MKHLIGLLLIMATPSSFAHRHPPLPHSNLRYVLDGDEADAGEIYLPASVNGKQVSFKFDSGAAKTIVSGIKSLDTTARLKAERTPGTGSSTQPVDLVAIKQLMVTDFSVKNFEALRVKDGESVPTLGIDFLKDQSFYFNSDSKNIKINSFPPKESTLQTLQTGKVGHIYLPVNFGDEKQSVSAMWDTGAGLTVIDLSLLQSNLGNFTVIKKTSTGESSPAAPGLYRAKILKIGDIEAHDLKVQVTDLSAMRTATGDDVRVLIGFNIISRHNWYFDLRNKKWSMN